MPQIHIRPYQHGDHAALMRIMVEMQGHLHHLDEHGAHQLLSHFDAQKYVDLLLRKVKDHNGAILFAFDESHHLMGCIIGTVHPVSEDDLLHRLPHCEGRINELIVTKEHRGKHVSDKLLSAMEQYFRGIGCHTVRVGCFAPNTAAHHFYHALGYEDRLIELVKKL